MSRVAVYLVEEYSQRAEKLGAGPRGERETCEGELGGLCGENRNGRTGGQRKKRYRSGRALQATVKN